MGINRKKVHDFNLKIEKLGQIDLKREKCVSCSISKMCCERFFERRK